MRQSSHVAHNDHPGRPCWARTSHTLIKSQDVYFRPKFELETPA